MPEYIERETLMQDISETVVFTVREGAPLPNAEMRGANKVIDRIKSAPTADVVKVVRCWKCRHCDPVNKHCDHYTGTGLPFPRKENDFCSYGELKECEGE